MSRKGCVSTSRNLALDWYRHTKKRARLKRALGKASQWLVRLRVFPCALLGTPDVGPRKKSVAQLPYRCLTRTTKLYDPFRMLISPLQGRLHFRNHQNAGKERCNNSRRHVLLSVYHTVDDVKHADPRAIDTWSATEYSWRFDY